jgi:hypothetical protein
MAQQVQRTVNHQSLQFCGQRMPESTSLGSGLWHGYIYFSAIGLDPFDAGNVKAQYVGGTVDFSVPVIEIAERIVIGENQTDIQLALFATQNPPRQKSKGSSGDVGRAVG